MVSAGYVDVDNEPDSGVVVYVFPELVGRPRLVPRLQRPIIGQGLHDESQVGIEVCPMPTPDSHL